MYFSFCAKYFFILLLINISVYSQEDYDQTLTGKLGTDAVKFGEDVASFYTSPLRFSGTDWLWAAGITGGSLLMIEFADEEMRKTFGRATTKTLNQDFWDFPTSYGIVTYANIASLGTYFTGLFTGNDDIRETGRLMFESVSISGVSVMLLRYLFGRVRPYYNEGVWAFRGFQVDNEYQSFPSGHTTVAFALSTVLAEKIDTPWSRILFYGLAAMTGYARIINNQHWTSDVVIGALLGLGSGLHVVYKNKNEDINNVMSRCSVYPVQRGVGFTFVIN